MPRSPPTRVHQLDQARAAYGALADTLVAQLWIGDPPADDAIEALAALRHAAGSAVVDRALAGRSGNEPVDALVQGCRTDPDWLDRALVEEGARAYRRLGLMAIAILASVSLLRGYHSSAVNKPLVFAARLEKAARMRLGETGRFVWQVCAPGGVAVGAPGWTSAVRVRLMHAQVRHRLLASARWDAPAWGIPINQADLCATGISFSMAVLSAARELGFHFSERESEGLLHLWRYVTWLMGCTEVLLWRDEASAIRVGELIASTQPGADAWSARLAQALRGVLVEAQDEAPLPMRPGLFLWRRYIDGLSWELNGPEMARDLEVPAVPFPVLPLTRALIGPAERIRRAVPGATTAAAALGHRAIDHGMRQLLRGREPQFERPGSVPGVHDGEAVPEARRPPPAFAGALFRYRRGSRG